MAMAIAMSMGQCVKKDEWNANENVKCVKEE
jgi:hypothetical protein